MDSKPNATWTPAFSRTLCGFIVCTLSFKWLLVIFSFVLIGWCYYHGFFFAFLFATLNRHPRALQNVRSITGDILNDRGLNCRAVSVRGITR